MAGRSEARIQGPFLANVRKPDATVLQPWAGNRLYRDAPARGRARRRMAAPLSASQQSSSSGRAFAPEALQSGLVRGRSDYTHAAPIGKCDEANRTARRAGSGLSFVPRRLEGDAVNRAPARGKRGIQQLAAGESTLRRSCKAHWQSGRRPLSTHRSPGRVPPSANGVEHRMAANDAAPIRRCSTAGRLDLGPIAVRCHEHEALR